MLGTDIERVKHCLAIRCAVVVATHIVCGFAEGVDAPQLPRMAHSLGQHEGYIVSVGHADCAPEDDGAKICIEPGLGALVLNQVSRKAVYIGLDVKIPAA